jgi:hypothetical protein
MNPDFLAAVLPFIGAVTVGLVTGAAAIFGLIWNERSKRNWEEYHRKEQNYKTLLITLNGFHVATENVDQKAAFLEQVNLSWLYCPDVVIKKAYAFLDTVQTGAIATENEKVAALAELVFTLRKDLLSRKLLNKTKLKAGDFRLLTANRPGSSTSTPR